MRSMRRNQGYVLASTRRYKNRAVPVLQSGGGRGRPTGGEINVW